MMRRIILININGIIDVKVDENNFDGDHDEF